MRIVSLAVAERLLCNSRAVMPRQCFANAERLPKQRGNRDILQKGLEQGLQRGESDLVLRMLQKRCGILSIDLQDLVRSLTIAQLEALGDALLDFNGMADLEVWFTANLSPD